MGTFTLNITLGNAEMYTALQVGDALVRLGEKLQAGDDSDEGRIWDVNGNPVGNWTLA